jgi:RNA polymerase sigma-70 factor, ECF subfamily
MEHINQVAKSSNGASTENLPTLQELVGGARLGDEAAFGHIYDRTYDRLLAYAWRRTFDQQAAEDVVGNTYIYVIERIKTFEWKNEAAFYGWLYKVTMSELSNYFRATKRYSLRQDYFEDDHLESLIDDQAVAIETMIDKNDDAFQLHLALAQLKKKDQRIVELFFFADASHKQIAEAVDMKEGAVRTRLHRSLQTLRNSMPQLADTYSKTVLRTSEEIL